MPRDLAIDSARFTAAELAAWAGFLRTHACVIRELDAQLVASHGLPLTHFDVLLQLSLGGGRMRMSELADAILLSRSGLTRMIDQLERAGLVQREPDAHDARGLNAALTRRGRAKLRTALAAHRENVRRRFLDPLTDAEQQSLAECWEAIRRAAEVAPRTGEET